MTSNIIVQLFRFVNDLLHLLVQEFPWFQRHDLFLAENGSELSALKDFHHTYPVGSEIDTPFPALSKQVWQAVCIAERQLNVLIGHQNTKETRNENRFAFFSILLMVEL